VNGARGQPQELAARMLEDWVGQPEQADLPEDLWEEMEQANLTTVSIPAEYGGAGGTLGTAADILRIAARYVAPIPLAETALLASWALSASQAPVPKGPLTAAPVRTGEFVEVYPERDRWRLRGHVHRVPAARAARRIVIVGQTGQERIVASVDPGMCEIQPGENFAGEPRDDVVLDDVRLFEGDVVPAGRGVSEEALKTRGALARAVMMAGALKSVLELSVRHARERHQFGRPIGKFQAIQQQLATLAGEVAAAGAVAEAAVAALESAGQPADATFEIAAAKIRVGEAVGTATKIAHQIHGAIGFTERHPLHHSTRRLWAWREEFGAESEWAARLGDIVLTGGHDELWSTITGEDRAR
jgi:acyl-CoA dehydrogenase